MASVASAFTVLKTAVISMVEAIVNAMTWASITLGDDKPLYYGTGTDFIAQYDNTNDRFCPPNRKDGLWDGAGTDGSLRAESFSGSIDFNMGDYISGNWTETDNQGANTVAQTDRNGGWLLMTTGATENDGNTYTCNNEIFRLESDLRVEWRIDVNEATQYDWFVGLTLKSTTNGFVTTDRIGFQSDDGDTKIHAICEKDSTETKTDTGQTIAADTATRVGFFYDHSAATVYAYVNDTSAVSITTNIPNDEELTFVFAHLTGEAVAHALEIDGVWWDGKRV